MSMWDPPDDEGPFSTDPPSKPYNWAGGDFEDPDEYVRVIQPKLSRRQRYNAWLHQRMLDGDYGLIDNRLTKWLVFPASMCGVYAALILAISFLTTDVGDIQARCLFALIVCVGVVGVKYGVMRFLRHHVRRYTADLIDERWFINQPDFDDIWEEWDDD